VDEMDSAEASSKSPPGSAGYNRQQSARYTKEPHEPWPEDRPPPVPSAPALAKAESHQPKTDSDGYLKTSIGAAGDDRCSGYLEPPAQPPGN